jgi:hypothetical protein
MKMPGNHSYNRLPTVNETHDQDITEYVARVPFTTSDGCGFLTSM